MRFLLLALALGCGGEVEKRVVGASADSESPTDTGQVLVSDTGERDTGTAVPDEVLSLTQVAAGGLSGKGPVDFSLVNPINGYTYLLDQGEGAVRYLTQGYVHPSGEWCLKTACAETEHYTPGRTPVSSVGSGMCLDAVNGRLFVPRSSGEIQVLDVTPEGEEADTYNRTAGLLRLPDVLRDEGSFKGPCVYVPEEDALLISSPTTGIIAMIDIEPVGVRMTTEEAFDVSAMVRMDDGSRVVVTFSGSGSIGILDLSDLSMDQVELCHSVVDVAVDTQTGLVWMAHGESPGLSYLDLEDLDAGLTAVPEAPDCHEVALDPSSGLVLAASSVEQRSEIVLVDGTEIVDRVELPHSVQDIARPSKTGDFVVIVTDLDDDLGFVVFDVAQPAVETDPPPVQAFVMTAIEQPADSELADLEAGKTGCEGIDQYIAFIENNASALVGMDIAVAVAITHNFVRAADFCGQLEVLDLLEGYGFELGYMIHNRPEYHCTNASGWDEADACTSASQYYCDPETEDCVFPGHEDYCALGDQDCFQNFLDARSLYTEARMPSGASFVFGADRSGLWEWDWVEAYRNMARPGGNVGHDTTAFGHLWAYSDQVGLKDPRGKDTGPWRVGDAVEAWAIGYADAWDKDSAFSDLVFLPGLSTSVLKLMEQHSNGLFLLDLFEADVPVKYTEGDFQLLNQLLRQAINRRGRIGPNVWYFHLHDLATVNLSDAAGVEQPSNSYMKDWVDLMEATQVEPGHMEWALPSEIRARWSEIR
jgi:hypothetical protein